MLSLSFFMFTSLYLSIYLSFFLSQINLCTVSVCLYMYLSPSLRNLLTAISWGVFMRRQSFRCFCLLFFLLLAPLIFMRMMQSRTSLWSRTAVSNLRYVRNSRGTPEIMQSYVTFILRNKKYLLHIVGMRICFPV